MNITMSIDELEDFCRANGLCYDAHMESNDKGILNLYTADWDSPNYGINVYLHITDPDEPVENNEDFFTVRSIEREVNDSAVEEYSREYVDTSHVASIGCMKELILRTIEVRDE